MHIYNRLVIGLILITALILAGCAITETSITTPEDGRIFSMKTTTLWKNVKDVSGNASQQGFQFKLGSSEGSLTPEQTAALGCVLNPASCKQ